MAVQIDEIHTHEELAGIVLARHYFGYLFGQCLFHIIEHTGNLGLRKVRMFIYNHITLLLPITLRHMHDVGCSDHVIVQVSNDFG